MNDWKVGIDTQTNDGVDIAITIDGTTYYLPLREAIDFSVAVDEVVSTATEGTPLRRKPRTMSDLIEKVEIL